MTQAIHVTAGNHRGPASERGLEQFGTPSCATEALLGDPVSGAQTRFRLEPGQL
jgi:hypothetical protein